MPFFYMPAIALAYAVSFALVVVAAVWTDWWLTVAFHLHIFTLFVVIALTIASRKKTYIEIDSAEIHFPFNLSTDLLFRLDRSWSDVAAIGIEDQSNHYSFQSYADELRKKLLFIYFKSGGHVNLPLRNIELPDLKTFVDLIVLNSERGACTPEFLEMQRQLPYLREEQALTLNEVEATADFTQFWEDELESHISTTNFVPLEAGQELQSGKFLIQRGISYGGMSAVYLATNHLNQTVVIKESSIPVRANPELRQKARELFEREALLLYKLDHKQISRVLDYFIEDSKDYLVLEYVQGRSLRQIVRSKGAFEESRVADIAMQICEILQYLHGQRPQVLHRDLSPDNLILRGNGEIVLIDFGAANEFIGTATGTIVGKQSYIAPEQFKGKATPQSDLYSLGGTMHFLLTGVEPEPLSQSRPALVNSNISPVMDDLISIATELELCNRVETASRFAQLIESSYSPKLPDNQQRKINQSMRTEQRKLVVQQKQDEQQRKQTA